MQLTLLSTIIFILSLYSIRKKHKRRLFILKLLIAVQKIIIYIMKFIHTIINIYFFIRENPTPRKVYFIGPSERVKSWLSEALTRNVRPDSNSRPSVQISNHLSSRHAFRELNN